MNVETLNVATATEIMRSAGISMTADMVSLPDEQELQRIMEEVRHKHKNTSKIVRLTA